MTNIKPSDHDESFYAASSREMTGLTPTIAHDELEAKNYEEVFPYLPPLGPNSVITVPDTPVAEGIHAEYRTKITKQNHKKVSNADEK